LGGGRVIDWTQIPEEHRAMLRRATMPDFAEWERQIRATGGCANPIRMHGGQVMTDAVTGELLDAFHTDSSPLGYLLIPCGNRRAEVCPSCSQVYQYDARQLVRAGLAGGKGVPATVALHPMLFVTLTAPSFGSVHARHKQTGKDGQPKRCQVRRDAPLCPHGTIMSCAQRHDVDDPQVGQALCLDCYDYPGAVLFNANAGELWRRLGIYLRRELARTVGVSRLALSRVARVSYVKVAEYQARGVVHFHCVIRIDGPDGPDSTPPDWATVMLLDACLRRALAVVRVEVPDPAEPVTRSRVLRFGTQVDTQAIYTDTDTRADGLSMRAVAGYIAKYATKAAETAGSTPRPIKKLADLDYLRLPPHTERMIRACFALAALPAFKGMGLCRTAHMLGYRGHCTTKSRRYSTTFGSLRAERKAHRDAERRDRLGLPAIDGRAVIIDANWTYVRSGLAYGEAPYVNAIRYRQAVVRATTERDQPGDTDQTAV
jgi:hypothetical protein